MRPRISTPGPRPHSTACRTARFARRQIDDKPRKAGICKGTPAPALTGGNGCRLRLRGVVLSAP